MRKNTPEQAEAKRKEVNERVNAWRRMQKEHHICRQCGGQDAYTLNGRTYCAKCCEINSERKRKWRSEHPGANAETVRKNREKRKADGVCVKCGRPKSDGNHVLCSECRAKQHRYRVAARTCNYPRGENGICWLCNKRPVKDGFKICQICYDRAMVRCKALNEKRDNRDHIWRKCNDRDRQKGQTAHCPGD